MKGARERSNHQYKIKKVQQIIINELQKGAQINDEAQ
jgi:hypothetical protein